MVNFTGQTRKRVVNLGDRRTNLNSRNYLEQTQQQRLEREQKRANEKAANLIKRNVKKYLESRRASDAHFHDWLATPVQSTAGFEAWIVDLHYISRYTLPLVDQHQLRLTVDYVSQVTARWSATALANALLVDALLQIVRLANRAATTETAVYVTEKTLACLAAALAASCARYHNIIDTLVTLLSKGTSQTAEETAVNIIYEVNAKDNVLSFVRFLASPFVKDSAQHHLHHIQEALVQQTVQEHLHKFDNKQKLNLLVMFLNAHARSEFTLKDYVVLGNILSVITFSLVSVSESMDDDDDSDDSSAYQKQIEVSEQTLQCFESLYSNNAIQQMVSIFKSADNEHSRIALNILSTLFHLVPQFKAKLCMIITITPGAFQWFYNQLKSDIVYQFFEDVGETSDYLKVDDIEAFYADVNTCQINHFWKTLYTFEELYSYWLIVSNDYESFSDDKLTIADVKKFLTFSKLLCLTLIFQTANSKRIYHDFDKLKDISISLLNQLHGKNLRLGFVSAEFWKVSTMQINVDTMTQIITEEENRIRELERMQDDSDDPMTERPKYKAKLSSDVVAKLEVLNKLPFFVDFNARVEIFHALIGVDKSRLGINGDNAIMWLNPPRLHAEIRRDHELEDAFAHFHKSGSEFKGKLSVTFFNRHGEQEVGIDGGGITKEFLRSVVQNGFSPETNLFKETPAGNEIYPNEDIYFKYAKGIDVETQTKRLAYIKFLGSVVGKFLYENVLLEHSFAPFFLSKWRGPRRLVKNSINDLGELDVELFENLMKLTKMSESELETLDLAFNVSQVINGQHYEFELIKGGSLVKVKPSNVLSYIHQMSNFKLNVSLHLQTKYFMEGLYEIITADWLKMFDSHELQMLISGSDTNIDIDDWKANVVYGGYHEDDLTIKLFWEVIEEFEPSERCKLLKYVTSVARAPLLGFGALYPKFGIHNSGTDPDRLPTASTCVNLLKLPDYRDKTLTRNKILYAINVDAGFDLS